MANQVGIINEQGFVMGQGLGFKPINESDLKKDKNTNDNNKDKNNK